MSIKILPYKLGSGTAKALANLLSCLRIHHDPAKSKYQSLSGEDLIYNFGNSHLGYTWMDKMYNKGFVLNHPSAIVNASHKKKFFATVQEGIDLGNLPNTMLPAWTLNKLKACDMIDQGKVYCRTLTRANKGRGIVVAHAPEEIVNAPLYVQGIMDAKREYRVHVFKGKVIDLVAKVIPSGEGDNVNNDIRNHDNGWVFARSAVTIPDSIRAKLSASAIELCNYIHLDVGAIDMIRDMDDNIYVLEANTAPGMEGTTLERYAEALVAYERKLLIQEV